MGKHIEDIHAFPLPLLHPRRQAGVKLLSCLASLGGGLVTPAKSTGRRPKRGVRGGLEQSGKFFHLGLFCVDVSMFWYFYWSRTHCWHKQVKFLWQSRR